ncbi:hypothetical protein [Corynebacterium endometrii]|uniref:Uncharacterized protein n=1 Tax=Corynebacterium endometrii TaxID=2488819 RepID=A0A4P7QJM1_9CORY|nr:hypothetical protein [Corynebacterium endometrii]QCB28987.1 hypothetical protein CENDO_08585 [Corynebacterium endometrii]
MTMTQTVAQLPEEAVLEGATLTEQHLIDHEFLLQGSPLAFDTPMPLVLVGLGVLLTVTGLLAVQFRTATPGAALAALLPAPFLLAAKHIWMIIDVSARYDFPGVAGYVARNYTEYWSSQSIALAVLAALAIINAVIVLVRMRRESRGRS